MLGSPGLADTQVAWWEDERTGPLSIIKPLGRLSPQPHRVRRRRCSRALLALPLLSQEHSEPLSGLVCRPAQASAPSSLQAGLAPGPGLAHCFTFTFTGGSRHH